MGSALTALNPVRDHVEGGNDLIGDKTAKIADDFLALLTEFLSAPPSVPVKRIQLFISGHSSVPLLLL